MGNVERVGFVGLGRMGHGIAKNILERGGHPLTVVGHHNRGPVEDLLGRGAKEVSNAAALAKDSDVVVLCLPSSIEVEATFYGPAGLLAGAQKGAIFIDTTTADPTVTRKIGRELAAIGCEMIDAALGRTAREAEAGRLSTYIGGDPAVIDRVRRILSCYADTVVVCGPLGAGTTCKLVNNSIGIGMVALIAEGFATAAKLGTNLGALSEVLSAGGANGKMWQAVEPWIRSGDDTHLEFTMRLGAKDVRTYCQIAANAGVATFIAQAISQTLQLTINQGYAERLLPALPGILADMNGAKIRAE